MTLATPHLQALFLSSRLPIMNTPDKPAYVLGERREWYLGPGSEKRDLMNSRDSRLKSFPRTAHSYPPGEWGPFFSLSA